MVELNGKAAVVTGGSREIGRAIVERLAQDGAHAVFNYTQTAEAAADVVHKPALTARQRNGVLAALERDLLAREDLP